MPIPWRVKLDIMRFYLWDMPRIEVEARKDELDHLPFSECMKKYSPEFRDWYLEKVRENTQLDEEQAKAAKFALVPHLDMAGARGAALAALDSVRMQGG